VHHHRTFVLGFQLFFLPHELFTRVFIWWKFLGFKFCCADLCIARAIVLKVETDWQLKVKLDCSALSWSFESIMQHDINLWPIKSTVSFVNFPRLSVMIKSSSELSFCLLPKFITSHRLIRSCREEELELKAKYAVDMVQKL
jgi:hypothetical protein